MMTLLLRHYRRFAMFSGGLALFCSLGLAGSGFNMSMVASIVVFAFSLILFSLIAIGVYAVVPQYRGMLEIVGISATASAGLMYAISSPNGNWIIWGVGGVMLMLAFCAMIWGALNSKMSRKIGATTTWRDRHSGYAPFPARLVWRHVVPGAAEPSDHCTGMMDRYDEDPEDSDTFQVTFKGRKGRAAKYTLTFLERDPPSVCRFFFQGTEADGTFVDGIFSLRTTVLDRDSCFVSCVEERTGLRIGRLIERWFDDALGYQHDKLLEKLNALYGETYGNGKSNIMAAE